MPIRVLHVVEDFSSGNTGVTSVVHQIVQWQANHCEWVGVYAAGPVDLPPPNGVHVEAADLDEAYGSWRYPAGGLAGLLRLIEANGVTVLHLHGLWRAASLLGGKAAVVSGVPVVLSVHGQTSPWALKCQGVSGCLDGYSLKAMSLFQARIDSWVRYRRGKYEFGGLDPSEAKDWLELYRQRTGLEGADLLWVLFRDNAGGTTTYWSIEQSRDRTR